MWPPAGQAAETGDRLLFHCKSSLAYCLPEDYKNFYEKRKSCRTAYFTVTAVPLAETISIPPEPPGEIVS